MRKKIVNPTYMCKFDLKCHCIPLKSRTENLLQLKKEKKKTQRSTTWNFLLYR